MKYTGISRNMHSVMEVNDINILYKQKLKQIKSAN